MKRPLLLIVVCLLASTAMFADEGARSAKPEAARPHYVIQPGDHLSTQAPIEVAPYRRTADGPTLVTVLPGNNSTSGNGRAPQGSRLYNNSKYIITGTEMTNSNFTGPVTSIGWQWNLPQPPAAGPPSSQSVQTTGNLRVYLKDTTGSAVALIGTFIDTNGVGYTKIIDATITIPTGLAQIDIDVPVGGPGTSTYTYTQGSGVLVIYVYNTTTALATPVGAPTVHCNTTVGGVSMLTYQNQTQNGTTGTATTFRPLTRFGGDVLNDVIRVPVVYALGKIPIPYGVPQTISVPVLNVNATTDATVDVSITVKDATSGTVRFSNTQTGVFVAAADTAIVSFPTWSPTITENDSIIVQTTSVVGEEVLANNRAVMVQNVNTNRFAYSQGPTPAGGVGFTGATGDFVAKFTSGTLAVIDSIQVNFNAGGQPYQLGIWDATGPGGTPGTNVYTSSTLTSAAGVVTIAINPAVAVNGDFFLGVKQTGTVNVAFSYQSETPIRPGKFYFTSPTGGTTWTDFSPNSPFRFMIEANIAAGSPMAYSSSAATQTNTAPAVTGGMNQQVIGMEVVTTGNLIPISLTQLDLSTTGTTNPATDISNARVWYTGLSSTFAPVNQFGITVASPSGPIIVTGSQQLVSGTNHFWLTYDVNPGATVGNFIDGEFTGLTVAGTPQTPSVTAPAGNREIKAPLAAGDYTVGLALFNRVLGRDVRLERSVRKVMRDVLVPADNTGMRRSDLAGRSPSSPIDGFVTEQREVEEVVWTLMDGNRPFAGRPRVMVTAADRAKHGLGDAVLAIYPTITAALADLNGLGVSGPVQFLLVDASYPSETFPLTINQVSGASASNTVTIRPQNGVTTTVSGSSPSSIFKLNGADHIILDGSNSGGSSRDMTLVNTNPTVATAVVWMASIASPRDSATNNVVMNCNISGNAPSTTLIGVVTSGSALGGVANAQNNNNTIMNNAFVRSQYGVAVVGPTGNETGNVITENLVGGTDTIGFNGIAAFQQRLATISNNTINTVVTASTATASGIRISGTADSVLITSNRISGIRNNNPVGWGSNGIQLNSSSPAAKVAVVNNFIWDVRSVGFNDGTVLDNGYGIIAVTGGLYRIHHNSVNMNTNQDSASGRPAALNIQVGGAPAVPANGVDLRNNLLVNSQTFGTNRYAIYSSSGDSVFAPINYNDYYTMGPNLGFLAGTNRATLTDWQAATGEDANSISADPLYLSATDLHITNTSSPASNAGTPIATVTTDIDGNSRSGSTPDMGADEFGGGGQVTLGVPVATNWNIVSLPVSAPVPNDSVINLYVNSTNPYAFAFLGGYVQRFVMANGLGYWVKSSATYTQNITGTPRDTLTVGVAANWNMIGSISTQIDTSVAHVTPSTPGLRTSNFFRYNNGYTVATTIDPGLGYWVKAASAGTFFMHAVGPSRPSGTVTGRSISELNSITITDANGGSQTLYFGTDMNNEIAVDMFAMPPAPPQGAFDARFTSADGGTMVQTHATEVSQAIEMPVTIQSVAYPLTVTWTITDGEYGLQEGSTVHPMRGEGRVTIGETDRLTLRLTADANGLPKEYALYQNYPNPFNPTTTIKYALPVESKVTAEMYNVLGQRVKTLISTEQGAGYHTVDWNGTNDQGAPLASGLYMLRLSAEGKNGRNFTDVRKLMFLK
jgi:hypothetical protein